MADPTPVARLTEARKSRHLDICLEDDVASHLDAGFSAVRLRHEALPECALEDVDMSTTLFGHALTAPILISSMTGGTERARAINYNLAIAAERAGVALALGSQRAALEDPALLATYRVRDVAPRVVLFANIGAVQFNYGVTVDDAIRAVENIGADGLYLHLNPLQEAIQTNGDTNFRMLLPRIGEVCRRIGVPVIAKSVGSGISVRATQRRKPRRTCAGRSRTRRSSQAAAFERASMPRKRSHSARTSRAPACRTSSPRRAPRKRSAMHSRSSSPGCASRSLRADAGGRPTFPRLSTREARTKR
jgi:hypothetical protein